jgi:hypothetical protein
MSEEFEVGMVASGRRREAWDGCTARVMMHEETRALAATLDNKYVLGVI